MPPARKALLPPSHPTSRGSFRRKYPPYWSDSRARRLPPIPAHLPGERRQLPFPWPSLTIPATCHFNLFLNRRFKDDAHLHDTEVEALSLLRLLQRPAERLAELRDEVGFRSGHRDRGPG